MKNLDWNAGTSNGWHQSQYCAHGDRPERHGVQQQQNGRTRFLKLKEIGSYQHPRTYQHHQYRKRTQSCLDPVQDSGLHSVQTKKQGKPVLVCTCPRFLLFSARQGACHPWLCSPLSPAFFSSSGIALLFTSAYLVSILSPNNHSHHHALLNCDPLHPGRLRPWQQLHDLPVAGWIQHWSGRSR
jgi:hypothetical protein